MSGNDILNNMLSFKLIKNSKNPTNEWRKENRDKFAKRGARNFNTNNYGIITGKQNNITVVDFDSYKLDWLTLDQHPIYKTFGGVDNKHFETLTVKTPNGGYHFYFKYEPEIKQTQSDIEIDIRSDGGYIISPNSKINGKKYKIIKDLPIKKMTEELKEFLLEHLYTKKQVERTRRIIKNGNIEYTQEDLLYKYNGLTEEDLRYIFDNLPNEYFINYNEWLIFTTACKYLNCFDLWDEYNQKKGGSKYDYNKNKSMWDGIRKEGEIPAFEILVNESLKTDEKKKFSYHEKMKDKIRKIKATETPENKVGYIIQNLRAEIRNTIPTFYKTKFILSYTKYADIKKEEIKFNKVIESQKLGYKFINENLSKDILLIKSDTGTGKTTSFKHYITDSEYNFISIVSRVSLGYEQYRTFNEHGAGCVFYKIEDKLKSGENVVITIDSILKLWDFDFSNYVVYLDEVSSIIEYLITSDTLNNTRILIYNKFFEILNKCKYIIGTDADLDDITIRFFDFVGREKLIINNTYKHNKNINTFELNSEEELVKKVKESDKYLICCDSKTNAEALYKLINDKEILLITSDSEEDDFELDKHNKIIISPKIIYGLDSVINRPVFVYYKEHTINPRHMVQQLTRCRNIDNLYYCFTKKNFNHISHYSLDELKEELIKTNQYGVKVFGSMVNDIVFQQYLEIMAKITFNSECYKTNKFRHFLNILEERGFNIESKRIKTKVIQIRGTIGKIKKDKIDNFKFEDYMLSPIQQILKLDEETATENKELYLFPHILTQHFNFIRYFNKDIELTKTSIKEMNDFILKKVYSTKSKIYFLDMLKNAVGCPKNKIETNKQLTEEQQQYLETNYKLLFRCRDKSLDFKDPYHIRKTISKISKNIFGSACVNSRKIKKEDGTTEYKFTYAKKEIERHNKIYEFRKTKKKEFKYIDDEEITEFRKKSECEECEKETNVNTFNYCKCCWENVKTAYSVSV
jgi:hypothetical protein